MVRSKRLAVASLSGFLFGLACSSLASSSGNLPTPVAYQIIAERTLMGFAIGISMLRLGHWSLHGLFMGCVFSLPLAFSGLMAPDNPAFSPASMVIWTVVLGMIYGLLTEVITTKIFRAPGSVRPAPQSV